MEIHLNKLGKRFNKDWIFRNLDLKLVSGESYAVIGPNGSGKSTLLKVLSGYLPATTGKIKYFHFDNPIDAEVFYKDIVYVAPYLELIEEFTLLELLNFHYQFKKIREGYTVNNIVDTLGMQASANKFIHDFSSGMKQRLKLGLAFYSEANVIMLDEPSVNLDEQGFNWYLNEIENLPKNKLILVASNQIKEYQWTTNCVNIQECKI